MIAPARLAAYDALQAVDAGRLDLPAALAHVRARLPDERDRALAGEIATGTLRWRGAIDHVIAQFARREPSRLDAEVLTILRLGIFQLLHLDRVPAAAVVDDAVEMTRKAGKRSAAGFVNALLRRASRERESLPLPPRPGPGADRDERLTFLSVTGSHPRWLVDRWLERHGFEEADAWTAFDNAPAPLTLRANTLRVTRDQLAEELARHGIETAPAAFAPDGLKVIAGNPLLTPLAHTGRFVVQDEASQLVGEFAAAQPGTAALDTCASPGGKTLQIAAGPGRRVVACDVRGRRVGLLARTIAEAGADVRIVQADARGALPFPAVFDLVLVDAPCSGLGTIRRDPDIKWRRQAADLPGLASQQRALLAGAAAMVRPGGRLVYATCSSEPEENEAVVDAFLDRHAGWGPPADPAPSSAGAGLGRFIDARGHLRTLPFRDGLEAFFAAALVKRADLR